MTDTPATTADLLGVPPDYLEFEGNRWPLREATLVERAVYQRWLEDELRAATARNVDSPDPDGDRQRDTVAIAAGVCEFDGELAAARRRTPSGQAKLWQVMYGFDADTAEKVQRANAERIAEVVRKAVIDGDPKAAGLLLEPLLRTLGLPHDFLSALSPTSTGPRRSGKSRRGRRAGSGPSTAATAATPPPASSGPPPGAAGPSP